MIEVISAKPTTYNGVMYRSRLEARFARWLDSQGVLFEYEPSWRIKFEVPYFEVCLRSRDDEPVIELFRESGDSLGKAT